MFLRFQIEKNLLSKKGTLDAEAMIDISQRLKELEGIKTLPAIVIRATNMDELLRKIDQLDEIPNDHEFRFRERVTALWQKWQPTLGLQQSKLTNKLLETDADIPASQCQAPSPETNEFDQKEKPAFGVKVADYRGQSRYVIMRDRSRRSPRSKRKISTAAYLSKDSFWINSTSEGIEDLLQDNEKDLEVTREKGTRLLKENAEELLSILSKRQRLITESNRDLELIRRKRAKLLELKDHLLECGAQDFEITKQWESFV